MRVSVTKRPIVKGDRQKRKLSDVYCRRYAARNIVLAATFVKRFAAFSNEEVSLQCSQENVT
jgi:hypothetical protein